MKKVNLRDLPLREHRSPAGKFQVSNQDISVALGREASSTDLQKRHPFDVALVRIPPGAARCPHHSHSAETEFYLVISGNGEVRDETDARSEVQAGDAFIFQPGEAHQLSNPGHEDFVYYVIADNPPGDTCYYPDSGKWSVWNGTEEQIIKGEAADYYAGEESLG
ncbi:MAG: cupin domain-containing protein [Verrucomicrobiota bacterium]